MRTFITLLALLLALPALAQSPETAERGSIIEDRAARKLLQAGDARLEVGENEKALEIWESVVERYPRSPVRFEAHLRLADHLLKEIREYDKARLHYEAAAVESNENDEQRAYAFLNTGTCFYEAGNYGKCFTIMRDVIALFPTSPEVNEAYYYIGLGHFKLGHYSRAIEALEKVGTSLSSQDALVEKVEAGKRLYIKIDDKDFAILTQGEQVEVRCRTKSGDEETLRCDPVGRNARIALGRIMTTLAPATPDNGTLEVRGGDVVTVSYIDAHTAEKGVNEKRLKEVLVVGNGLARITDGSYQRNLQAAVLGKPIHLQVSDADHDTTAGADQLEAAVQIFRRKTPDEIDDELAKRVASGELVEGPEGEDLKSQIDPLLLVRSEPVVLRESEQSGVFRLSLPLQLGTAPGTLTAEAGQTIRLVYADERHLGENTLVRTAEARVIEGNLGEVRVTRTEISDEELRLKTQLRTASALTEVGNHYKEFGLNTKADLKYAEALDVCEDILEQARKVGGSLLEETYVQLWRIYFAMDQLDLALGMSRRLLAEFPSSAFIDEAMLQQAHVERKRENFPRAISLYASLSKLPNSPLRGEGQFYVGECYEAMALKADSAQSAQLFEKAFLAYQAVYEQFPDSGRVGDAVAKMAAFYYQKEDYSRAVDVFENVLTDHPDANFLDVILFNYGRCLYKLNRKPEARRRFEQLINDYPESEIASEANKIVEALKKAGF
ncbi:MAG: tetratricopeptide repeat protein [Verrucomicrobia bacterium]|nr:tetratricopeptide repeat protein [Verrucomicrobiota bacterium]MDA1005320.1 tetratricopeptide repeat protein [Verrucomicrobiota bacterium]